MSINSSYNPLLQQQYAAQNSSMLFAGQVPQRPEMPLITQMRANGAMGIPSASAMATPQGVNVAATIGNNPMGPMMPGNDDLLAAAHADSLHQEFETAMKQVESKVANLRGRATKGKARGKKAKKARGETEAEFNKLNAELQKVKDLAKSGATPAERAENINKATLACKEVTKSLEKADAEISKQEKKAKKRKKWAIAATVVAAIATVVTFGAAAPALAAAVGGGVMGAVVGGIGAGAIAGAVGGAISGAGNSYAATGKITGKAIGQGALQGAAVGAVTGGIIGGVGALASGITTGASSAAQSASTAAGSATSAATGATNGVISNIGSGIVNGVKSIPQSITGGVSNVFNGVKGVFTGNMSLGNMAGGFVRGFGSSVKDAFLVGTINRAGEASSMGDAFRAAYEPRTLASDLLTAGLAGGVMGAFSTAPTASVARGGNTWGQPAQTPAPQFVQNPTPQQLSAAQIQSPNYRPTSSSSFVQAQSPRVQSSPASRGVNVSANSPTYNFTAEQVYANPDILNSYPARQVFIEGRPAADVMSRFSNQSNISLQQFKNGLQPMSLLMPGDAGFTPSLITGG